jgi:hypothetical protein
MSDESLQFAEIAYVSYYNDNLLYRHKLYVMTTVNILLFQVFKSLFYRNTTKTNS